MELSREKKEFKFLRERRNELLSLGFTFHEGYYTRGETQYNFAQLMTYNRDNWEREKIKIKKMHK